MSYTVSKVAKISGVSVRTLRYYDEIGLLKPAYIGESGYRFYEKEQLLILQQILFFRELGFELKQIQEILTRSDFDKGKALQSHKKVLSKKIDKMHKLIKNIDKTIDHLKRKTIMNEQEIFWGFSKEKQVEYEEYLANMLGKGSKSLVEESHKNIKGWNKQDWDEIKSEWDIIYNDLVGAIKNNLKVDSSEVQALVRRHFQIISKFYTPTKEIFGSLGQLYMQHPDFRKLYDSYHPKLAQYLAEAMRLFADQEL